MDYQAIKHFHMTCAASSGSLFILRGIWMLRGSTMLDQRWVKIAPHLIDTLLLASALTMAIWTHQYPFVQTWLTAKLIALVVYIMLGSMALKRGKTKTVRACAFVAAILAFCYIGAVAITKQAFIFM